MDLLSYVFTQRERGLQSGDFGFYRKYLVKRILSLRRRLAITRPPTKQQNSQKIITQHDVEHDQQFAHLLVLTSERAWAQAMQMKSAGQDAAAVPRSANGRRHVLSKLAKAVTNATYLLQLEQATDTGQSIPYARAYQLFFLGALALEKRQWKDSLRYYSELHLVHSQLPRDKHSATDLGSWALTNSWVDTNLRYAAHQAGIPRSSPTETIVKDHAVSVGYATRKGSQTQALSSDRLVGSEETRKSSLSIPKSIKWRARNVKLEDAATAQALGQGQHAEDDLRSFFATRKSLLPTEYAAAYDGVLSSYQDAADSVKFALDELVSEGVAQGDTRMQSLQITRTALHFALISWRIGRNRALCGNGDGLGAIFPKQSRILDPRQDTSSSIQGRSRILKRIKEQVVLYDGILQSIESIELLPGVASDITLMKEIQLKKAYFDAIRSVAVSQSYHVVESYRSGLAILVKSRDVLSSVEEQVSTLPTLAFDDPPQLDISKEQFLYLHSLVTCLIKERQGVVEIKIHANSIDRDEGETEGALIRNLHRYRSSVGLIPKITSWPPQVQSVPVKPIFLDIAYNYIDYPRRKGRTGSDDARVEKTAEKDAPKRGWFGFGR